ncbi:MAG TPA: PEP/pyruvate-binding domain-containing protein [Bacillota bacterium]|nr:PEP/pyruvate-binding domain-containing protein [Bacillota bacterium]
MSKSVYLTSYLDKNFSPELLGGKGKNLAFLTRNGVPVPLWLCVLANAFTEYLKPSVKELERLLAELEYDKVEEISTKILAFLSGMELDQVLGRELQDKLAEIGPGKFFAVRSSGGQEDTLAHSFAGLFETYLFIPGPEVPKYLVECWHSLFTPRALSYLLKNDMSPLDFKMAVVIQEMVSSQKSGILFQANPVGKLEEIVVVAGYGLGEGIVTDQIEVDTYYYNRITKNITKAGAEKKSYFAFDETSGSGVIKKELPSELRNTPVLTDDELQKVLDASSSIEKIYEHYQDIEWAFGADGRLYILQSRPITTIPLGPLHLYDNSNIIESYPGISTPLTFTLVRKGYENNFKNSFRKLGFSAQLIGKHETCFAEMIESIQGRIYYKLFNWYSILSLYPNRAQYFKSYFEEMIGANKHNEKKSEKVNLAKLFLGVKVYSRLLFFFLRWARYFEKYKTDFGAAYQTVKNRLRGELDNSALKEIWISYFDKNFQIVNIALINDLILMLIMGLTKKFIGEIRTSDPINPDELLNGLLVGEKDLESVKPVRSLMQMAEIARHSIPLKETMEAALVSADISILQQFPDFYRQFSEHLEQYGDRGIAELKLESRSFRQEPGNLIQVIINYSDSGLTSGDMARREENLRTVAESQLNELLKGRFIRGKIIRYLVYKLRYFIRNRENARMDRSRFVGLFREMFLRIGANWAREKILTDSRDVFYLTYDELCAFIDHPNSDLIRETIGRRREEYDAYKQANPPDRFWLKGDVTQNYIPQKSQPVSGAASVLQGMGCCPGVVMEEAVVLHSPKETNNVKNKILVAENTDPGWVYLIIGARGLIVEKGSQLSHTAIIGRELGIPTIVGVNNATTQIPNGARIKMDGGQGRIEIIA